MLWPKKNSYKEIDNEKKFLRFENSPPKSLFASSFAHFASNYPTLSPLRPDTTATSLQRPFFGGG